MCDFQHGTIECRGDGYCWDADFDGFDPDDHSMPCPRCNTAGWLNQMKEEAEGTISFQGLDSGTGVDIWENAVAVAMRENPDEAKRALVAIGQVAALFADEAGTVMTRDFVYTTEVGGSAS